MKHFKIQGETTEIRKYSELKVKYHILYTIHAGSTWRQAEWQPCNSSYTGSWGRRIASPAKAIELVQIHLLIARVCLKNKQTKQNK